VDEDHPRIEKAFQKYFHRASHTEKDKMEVRAALNDDGKLKPHPKHEFEVIVCHANVIRYFFCR
jgi:serine/threonine-protein phosphatase PGAM5